MLILFCSDPIETRQVDECFADQATTAMDAGAETGLIHLEALVNDKSPTIAVREIAASSPSAAIYRGWMVTPPQYADLHTALRDKGITLINSPEQYRHCHWLPECYDDIAAHSAKTVWLPKESGLAFDLVMEALRPFAGQPVILKDFVKS